MTNSLTTKFVSAVLAVGISTVSMAEVVQAKTIEFSYSPVELNNDEGAAQLNERIRKFARNNCRSTSPLQTPTMLRECREDVEAQLRAAIGENAE